MPLDFGVSALLTSEYERFMLALADLQDGGRRRARMAAARVNPDEPATRAIHIPAVDEVFQVVPRPTITKEMLAVHYAALRRGDPSPLSIELQQEIGRRAAMAARIARSPTPHWAQAYGSALTAVDNVQDLLTTVAVVGKLTIGPVARILERGLSPLTRGEALAKAAALTDRELLGHQVNRRFVGAAERAAIAAQIRRNVLRETSQQLLNPRRFLSRLAVPGFGVVMLASDILKLATLIAMAMFPAYAAYCAGGAAAMAAGVPVKLFGNRLKSMANLAANLNPWSKRPRLTASKVFRNIRPSVFNLMEVGQTSTELFGIGLTFGGIVGFFTDAGFGVATEGRGGELRLETPRFARTYAAALAPHVADVSDARLEDLRAAAALLQVYPFMLDAAGPFTIEEKIEASIAAYAALELLAPWYDIVDQAGCWELFEQERFTPPSYRAVGEADRHELAGKTWPRPLRWPVEGAPAALAAEDYLRLAAAAAARGAEETIFPVRDQVEGQLLASLVQRLYERSILLATASADSVSHELTKEHQVLESMCLAGLLINRAVGDDVNLRFFAAAAAELQRTNRRSLSPSELLDISAATGASLIKTLPSDAPAPPLPRRGKAPLA